MARAKTYEEIKQYIEIESNSGCKLLTTKEELEEEKIKQGKGNGSAKLQILCGECKKNIMQKSYASFKNRKGYTCRECSNKHIVRHSWDKDNLKELVEDNSNCELVDFYRTNGKKKRIHLILQCECGSQFDTDLSLFKGGKHCCNKCSNKKTSEKMTIHDDSTLKILIEDNSKYKYIKFDKVKNKQSTGYSVFLHIMDNEGYKYRIDKNSFHSFLKDAHNGFSRFKTSNIYTNYNFNLWITKNTNYQFLQSEYINGRFFIHLIDNEGYKYFMHKSNIDLIIKNNIKINMRFCKDNILYRILM
ncbi:hypothetical protein CLG_B2228 [Clostridium phage D-1873]|uniref:Uncharacterized protein n=1 Tax=Clostridium botulinum D str. 1873 TaxID=592027 RepID=A0A9P2LKE8_CLOBO|nr:hypothetical protein CLG_B2228 [Clostridium phage D-1873]